MNSQDSQNKGDSPVSFTHTSRFCVCLPTPEAKREHSSQWGRFEEGHCAENSSFLVYFCNVVPTPCVSSGVTLLCADSMASLDLENFTVFLRIFLLS